MDEFNNNDSDNSQFTPPVPPVPPVSPVPPMPQAPQTPPADQAESSNSYCQQPPVMSAPNVPAQKTTDGLGIASMILGIISVVICCCYGIGLLLAIPGLILGLVAKKMPETGKRSGFALAGIIISSISIGLNLIWLIYMVYYISRVAVASSGDWKSWMDELYREYDMFTKL